jgi:hypothetical protein
VKELDRVFVNRKVTIVSGMAQGADMLAIRYANERGLAVIQMPADWKKHGRKAGMLRNQEMLNVANGVVAFWDGQSVGTKGMIDITKAAGKALVVVNYTKE